MVWNTEENSLCSIQTEKLENLGKSGTHLNKFSKTDLSIELLLMGQIMFHIIIMQWYFHK